MSLLSIPTAHRGDISGEEKEVSKAKSPTELALHTISMSKEDAAQTNLNSENTNCRGNVWMARDLKIFSNSEYGYAVASRIIDSPGKMGSGNRQFGTTAYGFRYLNALCEFGRRQ